MANYESYVERESEAMPGVTLVIARMSFGRRLELMRRIREVAQKVEFLEAGSDARERMEAAVLTSEIDRLYVGWGVAEVRGLTVDGVAATPESLITAGPEDVFREALAAVKAECGLTEAERKN
ncbi:MAG: hypothetical protein ACRD96_13535 [Bryobacteraceae bacterium]